jgi:GNAT superfamily N-acetyltransferase
MQPPEPDRERPAVDGPRACLPGELPQVIGLVDAAMRAGSDQTMLTDYPLVYAAGNLENVRVVGMGERLVATCPVLPRLIRGDGYDYRLGVISPTATDPGHRHRGYGERCVASCVERMDRLGIEISVLWTMVATFPFYERNGYQAVRPDLEVLQLSSADAGRFRPGRDDIVDLDPGDAGRLAQVRALHEADGPGVLRALGEYAPLFSLPKMRTLLAIRDGQVTAYLVDSRAINKPGLIEGGGSTESLEGLVERALRSSEPGRTVAVPLLRTGHALRMLIEARLPERTPAGGGNTMVRINAPRAFFHAISGWLVRRAGGASRSLSIEIADAGEVVSLDLGRQAVIGSERRATHAVLTRRELAAVVFGPHAERAVEIPASLADLFPIELPIPPLDHS